MIFLWWLTKQKSVCSEGKILLSREWVGGDKFNDKCSTHRRYTWAYTFNDHYGSWSTRQKKKWLQMETWFIIATRNEKWIKLFLLQHPKKNSGRKSFVSRTDSQTARNNFFFLFFGQWRKIPQETDSRNKNLRAWTKRARRKHLKRHESAIWKSYRF